MEQPGQRAVRGGPVAGGRGQLQPAARLQPLGRERAAIVPGFEDAWGEIGVAYARSGKPEKAVAALEKALPKRPDDKVLLEAYANALFGFDRFQGAADAYARLLKLDLANVAALNN